LKKSRERALFLSRVFLWIYTTIILAMFPLVSRCIQNMSVASAIADSSEVNLFFLIVTLTEMAELILSDEQASAYKTVLKLIMMTALGVIIVSWASATFPSPTSRTLTAAQLKFLAWYSIITFVLYPIYKLQALSGEARALAKARVSRQ
jgi:hypothetical protein